MMGHGYKEYWALFLREAAGHGTPEPTLSGISAWLGENHDASNGDFGGTNWNYFALVLAHEHFTRGT